MFPVPAMFASSSSDRVASSALGSIPSKGVSTTSMLSKSGKVLSIEIVSVFSSPISDETVRGGFFTQTP